MKLSLERLKFLAANPSEVYAKETQAMARLCINAYTETEKPTETEQKTEKESE